MHARCILVIVSVLVMHKYVSKLLIFNHQTLYARTNLNEKHKRRQPINRRPSVLQIFFDNI